MKPKSFEHTHKDSSMAVFMSVCQPVCWLKTQNEIQNVIWTNETCVCVYVCLFLCPCLVGLFQKDEIKGPNLNIQKLLTFHDLGLSLKNYIGICSNMCNVIVLWSIVANRAISLFIVICSLVFLLLAVVARFENRSTGGTLTKSFFNIKKKKIMQIRFRRPLCCI